MIGDEDAQTPFELLRDESLRGEVDGLIAVLDSREKKIILSVSVSTVENRRRWKTSVKVSALRGTYSTIAEHCAGQAAPRSQQERDPLDAELPLVA